MKPTTTNLEPSPAGVAAFHIPLVPPLDLPPHGQAGAVTDTLQHSSSLLRTALNDTYRVKPVRLGILPPGPTARSTPSPDPMATLAASTTQYVLQPAPCLGPDGFTAYRDGQPLENYNIARRLERFYLAVLDDRSGLARGAWSGLFGRSCTVYIAFLPAPGNYRRTHMGMRRRTPVEREQVVCVFAFPCSRPLVLVLVGTALWFGRHHS
jgi:hypothetical protein